MSELISRIEHLETSNKRLQIAVYCFPALAVVAMLLGAKNSSSPPDGKFRNLTAEKIVVGGFDGKPSVVLTAENANGLDLAMVHIIGGDGDTRASLGHVDGRMTKFVIYGADGAKTELRASEKAGGTSIELTPAGSKESSIELKTDRDGGAGGLRVKSPETGKWARVVYNGSGAFVDSDNGAEVKPAGYELTNDEPVEDSLEADRPDKNPAAIAKKAKEEQNEKNATAILRAAGRFIKNGNREHGRGMLTDLINKYPDTKAAAEASKLLK
jgi:hypothetical protein